MSHPILKRAAPGVIAAFIAIAGGVAGGATATSGLRLNSYGLDASKPKPIEVDRIEALQPWKSDCIDCSERTLGYRWATARSIKSAVDCPQDSWSFERGCRDYIDGPAS